MGEKNLLLTLEWGHSKMSGPPITEKKKQSHVVPPPEKTGRTAGGKSWLAGRGDEGELNPKTVQKMRIVRQPHVQGSSYELEEKEKKAELTIGVSPVSCAFPERMPARSNFLSGQQGQKPAEVSKSGE